MAFGRNPHVAKAALFEAKASETSDPQIRARALRDAAHQWDRAAEREPSGKKRSEYESNAARNRELAESGEEPTGQESTAPEGGTDADASSDDISTNANEPRLWN